MSMRARAPGVARGRGCRERSGGADEGQGSHVVHNEGGAGEIADGIQNGRGKLPRGARGSVAHMLFHTLETEFEVFLRVVFALPFDHAAGNQQKSSTFFDADGG